MSDHLFAPHCPTGNCILHFWQSLDEDRQARAGLRRAEGLTGVVMLPVYHRLLHTFAAALDEQTGNGRHAHKDRNRLRLAAIAGLLAHTKKHEPLRRDYRHTIAAQMAQSKKNSLGPRVSDLRFRRLVQESNVEAMYPMLRRTMALMDGTVDIHALAGDIWFWGEPKRRQWAYDYYAKLPPSARAGAGS